MDSNFHAFGLHNSGPFYEFGFDKVGIQYDTFYFFTPRCSPDMPLYIHAWQCNKWHILVIQMSCSLRAFGPSTFGPTMFRCSWHVFKVWEQCKYAFLAGWQCAWVGRAWTVLVPVKRTFGLGIFTSQRFTHLYLSIRIYTTSDLFFHRFMLAQICVLRKCIVMSNDRKRRRRISKQIPAAACLTWKI